MTTKNTRGPVVIGAVILLASAAALAQVSDGGGKPSAPDGDRFAYVFGCAGQYFRIDLTSGQRGEPAGVPGVAPGGGGFDGCLVQAVSPDPQQQIIYAAMPTTRFVDSLGRSRERIVALQLPSLKSVGSVDIPMASDRLPKLRQDSAFHELVVSYPAPRGDSTTSGSGVEYVISTESTANMVLKQQQGQPHGGRAISGPMLSAAAYRTGSGRIVDGDRVIDGNGNVSVVSGYELLTAPLREQFQGLRRTGAAGNQYLDIVFADQAAGKMLFIVGWDTSSNRSEAGGGLVVYDAVERKVAGSFVLPYREAAYELLPGTPTVHLTPDGKAIVIEEYQWQPPVTEGTIATRLKTGKLAVIDAASGRSIATVLLSPAPGGSGRVVSFSPDGTLAYYAARDNLYVVHLNGGESQRVGLPRGFFSTAVVTADR